MVLAGGTAQIQAQQGQPLPATKVGVVNIGLLFTQYRKAELYKKELDTDLAPLKAEAEKIKSIVQQHVEWLKKNNGTDAKQREVSEKAVKDGQRALEDLDMAARRLIGKKQETQLILLYKEIHAGVQSYAQQNGFHIVLAYGDPPGQDPFTFGNINRKMGGMDMGAAIPFYWANGLDISNDVLVRLNSVFPPTPGGALTPTGGFTPGKQQ